MKKTVIIFLIWVVVINLFALLVLNRFNLTADTAYSWIDPKTAFQEKSWNLVDLHARWDSFWYLDIAQNGYVFQGPGKLSNIVFFPLYPALIAFGAVLFFGNFVLAGWLISLAALLLALIFLTKLIQRFHPEVDPEMASLYLLVFPTAFFFNAVYTEALFLFLSVATIYYARKKQFGMASLFGFLSGLTRVTGAILCVPLLVEQLRDYGIKGLFNKRALAIFIPPLGALSLLGYHFWRFGDWALFFKVESSWGRNFSLNQDHLIFQSSPAIANFALDVLFVLLALWASYYVAKKIRLSYGLYMLVTILVALSTGTLMSIGRYILVLFPLYFIPAMVKNVYFKQAWLFVSILLLAFYTILFVNYYWAG